MISIERIKKTDLNQLSALYKQFRGEDSPVNKMKQTFGLIDKNENYILLGAIIANSLVGTAMGVVCEELYGECYPFMVIENVIVDQNYHGHGIGSGLMKKLEEYAVTMNCNNIILITESGREKAVRFYNSLDYGSDEFKGFKKKLKDS